MIWSKHALNYETMTLGCLVMTLEECEACLEKRRQAGGDLHPDAIKTEQERFFKSIEQPRMVKQTIHQQIPIKPSKGKEDPMTNTQKKDTPKEAIIDLTAQLQEEVHTLFTSSNTARKRRHTHTRQKDSKLTKKDLKRLAIIKNQ